MDRIATRADLWLIAVMAAGLIVTACVMPSDLELEQRQYCNNVADGVWPDYESGRYKRDCGGKDPPKFNERIAK